MSAHDRIKAAAAALTKNPSGVEFVVGASYLIGSIAALLQYSRGPVSRKRLEEIFERAAENAAAHAQPGHSHS